jgi:hypothetical protein
MADIAIITHEHDDFMGQPFFLQTLAEYWQRDGHRMFLVAGLRNWPQADIAIMHVDLSVVPQAYVEAAKRYPVVINGNANDIRKRIVSRNLVRRGDGYTGPVIIKTDLNSCGHPEARLMQRSYEAGDSVRSLPITVVDDGQYPILRSASEIPDSVWENPGLVVERFLPERDERGFWVRIWMFFGDRERCRRYRANHPLVKGANVLSWEPAEVPDAIRAERRRLGFDYGKFDFAIAENGEPVLYDANRTPGGLPEVALPGLAVSNENLARGLEWWLKR